MLLAFFPDFLLIDDLTHGRSVERMERGECICMHSHVNITTRKHSLCTITFIFNSILVVVVVVVVYLLELVLLQRMNERMRMFDRCHPWLPINASAWVLFPLNCPVVHGTKYLLACVFNMLCSSVVFIHMRVTICTIQFSMLLHVPITFICWL